MHLKAEVITLVNVDGDEVNWVGIVGVDPTNLGGDEDDIKGLVDSEESVDSRLNC